nr:paraquat-inducible protein A [Oceanicoccus sagamiensis]
MNDSSVTNSPSSASPLPLAADIVACHDCDLLLRDKKIQANRKATCPRCDAVLHITRPNSMSRTLALSLTGLILFIPANTLPVFTLEIMGLSTTNTMVNGIVLMAKGGIGG